MECGTDTTLWNYAQDNNLVIVTKDSDFYERLTIKGSPPRLIWIRTGNVSTAFLLELFRVNTKLVNDFIRNTKIGYLEIL